MEILFIVAIAYGVMQRLPADWSSPLARPFIALAIGMILSGVEHIVNESGYEQIMQDWIPNKPLVIRISVAARILSGVALLFPTTRRVAAYVCFVLYCIVLPVNARVAFAGNSIPNLKMPIWRRWLRFGLHLGWLGWCFWCMQI